MRNRVVVISDDRDGSFGPFVNTSNFPGFAIPFSSQEALSCAPFQSTVFLVHLPLSREKLKAAGEFFKKTHAAHRNAPVGKDTRILVHAEKQYYVRSAKDWLNSLRMRWMVLPNVNACVLASAAIAADDGPRCEGEGHRVVVVIGNGLTAQLVVEGLRQSGRDVVASLSVETSLVACKEAAAMAATAPRAGVCIVSCAAPPDKNSSMFDDEFFLTAARAVVAPFVFVSIGHESSIDAHALVRACDLGLVRFALVNLYGHSQRGPFSTDGGVVTALLCRRASTDARISRVAWDMIREVAAACVARRISSDLFMAQRRRFTDLGRLFWSGAPSVQAIDKSPSETN